MVIRNSVDILNELTKLERLIKVIEEQIKHEVSEEELELILKKIIQTKINNS